MNTYVTNLPINPAMSGIPLRDAIINHVVDRVAPRFVFGYHVLADIKQEAWGFALECLAKGRYDGNSPLEKLLYVHINNQLLNLLRKQSVRLAPPCETCPFLSASAESKCEIFDDRADCDKYRAWQQRNRAKSTLNNSASGEEILPQKTCDLTIESLISNELGVFVESQLSETARQTYLTIIHSGQVNIAPRQLSSLEAEVINLLGIYNG